MSNSKSATMSLARHLKAQRRFYTTGKCQRQSAALNSLLHNSNSIKELVDISDKNFPSMNSLNMITVVHKMSKFEREMRGENSYSTSSSVQNLRSSLRNLNSLKSEYDLKEKMLNKVLSRLHPVLADLKPSQISLLLGAIHGMYNNVNSTSSIRTAGGSRKHVLSRLSPQERKRIENNAKEIMENEAKKALGGDLNFRGVKFQPLPKNYKGPRPGEKTGPINLSKEADNHVSIEALRKKKMGTSFETETGERNCETSSSSSGRKSSTPRINDIGQSIELNEESDSRYYALTSSLHHLPRDIFTELIDLSNKKMESCPNQGLAILAYAITTVDLHSRKNLNVVCNVLTEIEERLSSCELSCSDLAGVVKSSKERELSDLIYGEEESICDDGAHGARRLPFTEQDLANLAWVAGKVWKTAPRSLRREFDSDTHTGTVSSASHTTTSGQFNLDINNLHMLKSVVLKISKICLAAETGRCWDLRHKLQLLHALSAVKLNPREVIEKCLSLKLNDNAKFTIKDFTVRDLIAISWNLTLFREDALLNSYLDPLLNEVLSDNSNSKEIDHDGRVIDHDGRVIIALIGQKLMRKDILRKLEKGFVELPQGGNSKAASDRWTARTLSNVAEAYASTCCYTGITTGSGDKVVKPIRFKDKYVQKSLDDSKDHDGFQNLVSPSSSDTGRSYSPTFNAATLKRLSSGKGKTNCAPTLSLLILKEASKINIPEWRPNELANVIWFLAKCDSMLILDTDLLVLLREFHRLRPEKLREEVRVRMEEALKDRGMLK